MLTQKLLFDSPPAVVTIGTTTGETPPPPDAFLGPQRRMSAKQKTRRPRATTVAAALGDKWATVFCLLPSEEREAERMLAKMNQREPA